MGRKNISRNMLLLLVAICLFSCDKYPDPVTEYLKNYHFSFQNAWQQKYLAGDTIDVVFNAFNRMDMSEDSLKVVFEVVWGQGSLTKKTDYTDSLGLTHTTWILGTGTTQQKLKAKTFDKSGKLLTSTELLANVMLQGEWNKINNDSYGLIQDMVADTVNKITLMISNGAIYKQGARYFDWTQIQSLSNPRTITVDRNGVFYVSTYDGSVLKSTNHGTTWLICAKPYEDYYNTLNVLSVTRDNYLWVYSWNKKVRFSKNGGDSWEDVASGMTTGGLGDIFRMKDGSLLYHGTECCSLYRSVDETRTWKKIEGLNFSQKIYVDENDKIVVLSEGNIFTSTDYGATFTKVSSVGPSYSYWSDNVFNKWKGSYYILLVGWGILKSDDLSDYQDYLYNSDMRNLFIDHNGNLFATDFNNNNYYKENSGASPQPLSQGRGALPQE